MNNACTTFQNTLAEQLQQLEKIRVLVADFATAPTETKKAEIEKEINEVAEVVTQFFEEYKKQASALILTWMEDFVFKDDGTVFKNVAKVGEDGMVSIDFNSSNMFVLNKYWPSLVREARGHITVGYGSKTDSLKNTEIYEGTLSVPISKNFSAPNLIRMNGTLAIHSVQKIDFPKLKKSYTITLTMVEEARFPQLETATALQLSSVDSVIFSSLKTVEEMIIFTDSQKNHFREAFPVLEKVGKAFNDISIKVATHRVVQEIRQLQKEHTLVMEGKVVSG